MLNAFCTIHTTAYCATNLWNNL